MVRGNRSVIADIGQAAMLALWVALPGVSLAQSVAPSVVEPAVTFPVTSAAELITPLAPPPAGAEPAPGSLPLASLWADPRAVARLFREACIQTEGQAAAAVDWALAQGFSPVDPMRGSTDELLAGEPGTVLAAPGSDSRVLLVAAQGARCMVWAERLAGPGLRLALVEMTGELAGKGARVQLQVERSIERSGAWRTQMQWRYRRVGGSQDFGIGSVTTLSAAPGTQALHFSPLPAATGIAPDGLKP
ncbi:NMCC_0638 family (lipo)protein [Rhizobacter sp. P5_C2]